MEKLLLFLQGKKASIVAIIAIIVTYALDVWYISIIESWAIISILGILSGTASYKTKQMYDKV